MWCRIQREHEARHTQDKWITTVIVGTQKEEGHDEIVEKVVKRLAENNLYMKPEKCYELKTLE